jgi:hypothetical protein
MKKRILFLTLVFSSVLFSQSYISRIIPDYQKLDKPAIKTIAVERTNSAIQFTFHSAHFSITQSGDLVQPLITVEQKGKVADKELIDAECTIVSFDADRNGVTDCFIVFPYGLTGSNANVDIVASFFFFPDSSFKFVNLRSYYGDTDLFRDFNHDGRYEYACVNELWSNSVEYDAVNLFSINNGVFTNCTKTTPGFPVIAERTNSGPVILKQLPASITADWYLKRPDVLLNSTEALN